MDVQPRPNTFSRLVHRIRGNVRSATSARVNAAQCFRDEFRGGQASSVGGDSFQEPGAPGAPPPPYDDVIRAGDTVSDTPEQSNNLGTGSSESQGEAVLLSVELQRPQASDENSEDNEHAPKEDHRTHYSGYQKLSGQTGPDARHRGPKAAGSGTRKSRRSLDTDILPSSTIAHVGSDGATSYYDRPKLQTTPGFEWASSSNGYDWESRKIYYGSDNPTMGSQAYQRQLRQREMLREENLVKAEAMREEGIRIAGNERWVAHKA